jgi:hypothetical protein
MGLGDEYSRDAFIFETVLDTEELDEPELELDPEDWQAMYSDEILDGWMYIREFVEERYLKLKASYPKFVELIMEPQKWFSNGPPEPWQLGLWSKIRKIHVISERVSAENFWAWSENFVEYL